MLGIDTPNDFPLQYCTVFLAPIKLVITQISVIVCNSYDPGSILTDSYLTVQTSRPSWLLVSLSAMLAMIPIISWIYCTIVAI